MMESDFKAYIHQKIDELSSFFGAEEMKAQVEIKKVNTKKMLVQVKRNDPETYENVKGLSTCYFFSIQDGNFKIKGYGFGHNQFEALDNAKKTLEKELIKLNDEAVSNKDRVLQINRLLNSNNKIH